MGLPREQYKRNKCCFREVVAFFLTLFKNKRTVFLKYSLCIGLCLVTFLLLCQPTITGEVREEKVYWELAYPFRG